MSLILSDIFQEPIWIGLIILLAFFALFQIKLGLRSLRLKIRNFFAGVFFLAFFFALALGIYWFVI